MEKSEIVAHQGKIYHLGLRKDQVASHLILVGDPARTYKVAKHFDEIRHEVKNREYITLTGTYKGLPVSVMGTGMGTDNIEIAISELFSLHEFDLESGMRLPNKPPLTLIRVGTSGGVQRDIPVGTYAISSYALGLDNTGLFFDHQAADEDIPKIEEAAYEIIQNAMSDSARFKGKIFPYASKASPRLVEELCIQANKSGQAYRTGITASTSGFYGPSARYLAGFKNSVPHIKQHLSRLEVAGKQIINMEMESSILFHLCHTLTYEAATICPVISNPFSSDAIIDYQASIENAIKIALDTLLAMGKD